MALDIMLKVAFVILIFFCCSLLCNGTGSNLSNCTYTERENPPETFFINVDAREDRRNRMTEQLQRMHLPFIRVRAQTPSEVIIPPDISKPKVNVWMKKNENQYHSHLDCKYETRWKPPAVTNQNTPPIYLASLCSGHPFSPQELATTVSHLMAIRQACSSKTTKSRYALIVEDDITFPMDIDWNALVLSAPRNFGILHLHSSPWPINHMWKDYVRNSTNLWSSTYARSGAAYLIDLEVMRPRINKIVQVTPEGWLQVRIIAGGMDKASCQPQECCEPGTNFFKNELPCVQADHLVADVFLYRLAPSYTLKAPISCLGDLALISDMIPDGLPRQEYRYASTKLNQMLRGEVPLPSFVTPACQGLLPPII